MQHNMETYMIYLLFPLVMQKDVDSNAVACYRNRVVKHKVYLFHNTIKSTHKQHFCLYKVSTFGHSKWWVEVATDKPRSII